MVSPHRQPGEPTPGHDMDTTTINHYSRMRNAGYPAATALQTARTLQEWEQAKSEGLVCIWAEPEHESYFDVFGEPGGYTDIFGRYHSVEQERAEIMDQLERFGCWRVVAKYRASVNDEWQTADSVGMCVYENPLDPRQNWYVPELMRRALEALKSQAFCPAQ